MVNLDEPVRRSKRTKNFTIIGNDVIQDSRITIEARGVLIYILSLPQDWVVRKKDLQKRIGISRRAIDRCFDEMKQYGYLCETDLIKKDGKFDGKGYIVYDYSILQAPPSMYSADDHNEHRNEIADDHIGHWADAQNEHRADAQNEHLIKKEVIQQSTKIYNKEINIDMQDFGPWSEAMRVWIDYKKKMKKPYKTERGINSCLNDLKKVCKDNPQLAMLAVEYCMNKEWQGIYAPKEPLTGPTTTGLHVDNEDYKLGKFRYKRQHEFPLYDDYVKNCKQYGHTIKPEGYDYNNGL